MKNKIKEEKKRNKIGGKIEKNLKEEKRNKTGRKMGKKKRKIK